MRGAIAPVIEARLPFADAPAALRRLADAEDERDERGPVRDDHRHALPRPDAAGHQPASDPPRPPCDLGVGERPVVGDDVGTVGMRLRGRVERRAERVARPGHVRIVPDVTPVSRCAAARTDTLPK
jgi:hypothetical protein